MHRSVTIFTVSLLVGLQSLFAESPFDFRTTPGKLPKDVVPRRYDITIAPSLESGSFTGSVLIDIEASKAVHSLVLNSLELKIDKAELQQDGDNFQLQPSFDEKEQLLKFALPRDLPAGNARLSITFHGTLKEAPEGLFVTRYPTGNGEKKALATQFEAADARRMFPCWDEPVFRAQFRLRAKVPTRWLSISNMPIESSTAHEDGTSTVNFAESPKMPTYLLAFASGELEALEDEVEGIKLRMITTEGKREQARYALEVTKLILPYYNEYFGVRYPLPKLDQFSFPSTGAAGMENWGAILYNDTALLFDPKLSSQRTKEGVFGVVAHEIAHQWFGNLVTMAWWDNLWLNEGFASWMATKATDHFNPDWKVWLRAAEDKEHAMSLDSRQSTHPIQQKVETESQANDAFDVITYQKGQSFLRMLENWLGAEDFRNGIRQYMQTHAFSNTTTANLWAALDKASGKPVTQMAAGWTEQPGFPLVKVEQMESAGIRISQERFSLQRPVPDPRTWEIPILSGNPIEDSHAKVSLLAGTPMELPRSNGTWKVNLGDTGYYRAKYDDALLQKLAGSLLEMPEADRLNIVNDYWALVDAGAASAADWLRLIERLKNDPSTAMWERLLDAFDHIDWLSRGTETQSVFREWASTFVQPKFASLGWQAKPGESPLDVSLRGSLISFLGKIGDAQVSQEAKRRFDLFLKNPATLGGDLRTQVFRIVGRAADSATYTQLHELARKETSTEQKQALYNAMAAARNPDLADKTLPISLTDELAPRSASGLVLRVAEEHPQFAWKFAQANLTALMKKQSSISSNDYVPRLFQNFSDATRADELEAFASKNLPKDCQTMVTRASEAIRHSSQIKPQLLKEIGAWCRSKVAP